MYQLKRSQIVKADIKTCWEFFSSPTNLAKITPPSMGFIVRTEVPAKMYEGLMIEYTIKPLLGIPLRWVTEIKTVQDEVFFIDEQRIGPYKIWHHEHHFKVVEGGVEMNDIVSYVLPLGIIGRAMHALFIKNKIKEIFTYRYHKVEELFNK
ncbi:MAG: SRPBCC family protein [Crocinitomicaceae bacterium]|jgi:ligand-binding SRPBCC domain-containing protein|nr:SRPBCC family protein [Crocinitomicaceae bacterium]